MIILFSMVAAIVPMLGYLFIIWRFDRYDREPVMLVLMNYFWGAVGAIILTLLFNGLIQYILFDLLFGGDKLEYFSSVVSAPIIEELTKGLFLLVMIQNKKYDNITDGIVYGSAIGLGFGMTENFFYFVASSNSINTWLTLIVIRTLFSAVMHCVATGTLGAFLGYAKFKKKLGKISFGLFGLLIAMIIRSVWNTFVSYQSTALIGIAFMIVTIIVFFLVFTFSLNTERKIIFSELLDEAQNGIIPSNHLSILNSSLRNKLGWIDESIRKAYINSATRLAFRKMQYKISNGVNRNYHEAEIDNLRKTIAILLGKI